MTCPINRHLDAATVQGKSVRAQIVLFRKDQGLTTAEIARRVRISRPIYTQLENGGRKMDLVYFLRICRVLGVDPGELLE